MKMKWILRLIFFWFSIAGSAGYAHDFCDPDVLVRQSSIEQQAWTTNSLHATHKAHAVSPARTLKVATWNLNLLNVRGWRTPFYKVNSRRLDKILGQYLAGEAPDVIFLQEVWSENDRKTVRLTAAGYDYKTIDAHPGAGRRHGLQVLYRQGTIVRVADSGFEEFHGQRALFEKIGAVRRGLLWAKIHLDDGQTVLFGNTHFTAFNRYSDVRLMQIEGLRNTLLRLNMDVDTAVIGGDLNIAADFEEAEHFARHVGKLKSTRWLYSQFAEATGLRDTFRAAELNDPGYTFNSLVGGGPERRLDYLWAGELAPHARTHVVRAERKFTDAIDGVFASDHFLVQAVIDFFQIPKP